MQRDTHAEQGFSPEALQCCRDTLCASGSPAVAEPFRFCPNRYVDIVLKAALLTVAAVFLALSWYAHPAGDDWGFAHDAQTESLLPWLWRLYFQWQGRFLSSAVLYLLYRVASPMTAAWILPLVLQLGWIATFYAVCRATLCRGHGRRTAFWAAMLLHGLYLSGLSHPREAYYWVTGAVTFQFGLFLFIWAALFLFRWQESARSRHFWVGGVLACLAAAYCEVQAVAVVGTVLAFFFWRRHAGHRRDWRMGVVAAASILGAILLIAAPGNFARAAADVRSHALTVVDIPAGIGYMARLFLKWLLDPRLWAATLLLFPLLRQSVAGLHERSWPVWTRYLPFVLLALLVPGLVMVYVGYQKILVPFRVRNALYMLYLLYWFCACAWWLVCLRGEWKPPSRLPGFMTTVAAAIFMVAVVLQGHFPRAARDLVFRGRSYDATCREQYARIREAVAEGRQTVVIPQFINPPWTLRMFYLTNPESPINQGMARYFGISRIEVDAMPVMNDMDPDGL